MPTFEEARSIILDRIVPLGIERVGVMDSLGRVIAEDVIAPWDMPLCDNSAMDGFAVRAADCTAIPVTLKVTGYIQPQIVSDDWVNPLARYDIACRVDVKNIAPGASVKVICTQIDLNVIGDASKTPDTGLAIDWRPDVVEFADGSKLSYDINALTTTLLWNHYTIDGAIK